MQPQSAGLFPVGRLFHIRRSLDWADFNTLRSAKLRSAESGSSISGVELDRKPEHYRVVGADPGPRKAGRRAVAATGPLPRLLPKWRQEPYMH